MKRDRLVRMGDLHPEICGILSVFNDVSLIPASLGFVRDHTPLPQLIRRCWGGILDYGATAFREDFNLDWLKNTSPISELPVPGKDDLHADFGNC